MFLHLGGFKCQQCGKCCQTYIGRFQATEEDIIRWTAESREDILKWVSPVDFGDHVEYDFPIHPVTDDEFGRCPFFKKLPNKDIYICQIHNTKPEACARYPSSQREREECPGVAS